MVVLAPPQYKRMSLKVKNSLYRCITVQKKIMNSMVGFIRIKPILMGIKSGWEQIISF